jgi:hypothetical protein
VTNDNVSYETESARIRRFFGEKHTVGFSAFGFALVSISIEIGSKNSHFLF